jgi:hypothetical protein
MDPPDLEVSPLMCSVCYDERELALVGGKYLLAPCSLIARRMRELQDLAGAGIVALASDIGHHGGLPAGLKLNTVKQWVKDGIRRVPCECTKYSVHQGHSARAPTDHTP